MKTMLVPKKHDVCVECGKSLNPRTHKLSCKGFMRSPVCNTCGNSAFSPYRVYDEYGKVIEGCVDEIHTGHLVTPSESSFWHTRKEAIKIRRDSQKHLTQFREVRS
jgi:hypothetical protein